MRKIVVIISLSLFSLNLQAQTWASLASNQAVTWNALKDAITNSIFPYGGTAVTGTLQCVYKNLATITNYVGATLNGTRDVNDLLIKSDFSLPGTSIIIYTFDATNYWGYNTASAACAGSTSNRAITMYYTGSLAANTRVSFNGLGNAPALQDGGHVSATYFKYSGGQVQLASDANGYYIVGIGPCITGTVGVANSKTIQLTALSPTPTCSFSWNITGTYTAASDGLSHTWHLTYNVVQGNATQTAQTPISDVTSAGLVTGDVISKIDGGTPITFIACGGSYYTITNNIP